MDNIGWAGIGYLLRGEEVETSIGPVLVKEFTFKQDMLFKLHFSQSPPITQVSFICPFLSEEHLRTLGEEDINKILAVKEEVNTVVKIPEPEGKTFESDFDEGVDHLCTRWGRSAVEISETYSVSGILYWNYKGNQRDKKEYDFAMEEAGETKTENKGQGLPTGAKEAITQKAKISGSKLEQEIDKLINSKDYKEQLERAKTLIPREKGGENTQK